jgi:hypothetical protein
MAAIRSSIAGSTSVAAATSAICFSSVGSDWVIRAISAVWSSIAAVFRAISGSTRNAATMSPGANSKRGS